MEEITFRNKREDLDAYYEYFLNTEEGKQIGKKVFFGRLWFTTMIFALVFILIWGTLGYLGLSIKWSIFLVIGFVFLFLLAEVFALSVMGFKPFFFVGRQVLKKSEKSMTDRDLQILHLSRTIKLNENWLEVRTSQAVHQWRWSLIDTIGITSNFIFLHAGKCCVFYIPKRDFSTEEGFQAFSTRLRDLAQKHKNEPLLEEPVA